MAMGKCKECGKEVSSKAVSCPSCGAPGPGAKRNFGCGSTLLVIFIAIFSVSYLAQVISGGESRSPSSAPAAAAPAAPAVTDAQCMKDLSCWGERNSAAADVRCARAIQGLAKYEMKWTNGFLEPRFNKFGWADQPSGKLRYFGDKASFQNGFGAWKRSVYSCDYDPSGNRVIDARVE